jgi:hypothetical protein
MTNDHHGIARLITSMKGSATYFMAISHHQGETAKAIKCEKVDPIEASFERFAGLRRIDEVLYLIIVSQWKEL